MMSVVRSGRILLPVAIALCGALPPAASAGQIARISAKFSPEHLAEPTTVHLGFRITAPGQTPAPLRGIELGYPANLGFATSGLGLSACEPAELEILGPTACPPDSRIGSGHARVEIPIGPQRVEEAIVLTLFAGPSPDGYLHLLVYASGMTPVIAQVLLSGVLLPRRIDIVVPPIPSLPEAPYVAVSRMQLTLGGNLTYSEKRGGRSIAYRPPGVGLPRSCPQGGFRFTARFDFLDGERTGARTAVACPRGGRAA